MRIEDLKNWTVDQLKEEVVRLADEREARNRKISQAAPVRLHHD